MWRSAAFAMLPVLALACGRSVERLGVVEPNERAALSQLLVAAGVSAQSVQVVGSLEAFDLPGGLVWAQGHVAQPGPTPMSFERRAFPPPSRAPGQPQMHAQVAVVGGHVRALRLGPSTLTSLAGVRALPQLVALDASVSHLASVADLPCDLGKLELLSLVNTKLASLKGVECLPALRVLHVAGTNITDLRPALDVPSLVELNAGLCQITDIPDALMPALKVLSLEGNALNTPVRLPAAPELEHVNLSFAGLTAVPTLVPAPNVRYLSLWGNRIQSSAGIELGGRLHYVGLGENPLAPSPDEFARQAKFIGEGKLLSLL
jgi:Leucine-rich repeat (LRR) protein